MEFIDLGWGESFNVASVYPDYANLTSSDFYIIGAKRISFTTIASSSGSTHPQIHLAKSYNKNTGVMTACLEGRTDVSPYGDLVATAQVHACLVVFDPYEKVDTGSINSSSGTQATKTIDKNQYLSRNNFYISSFAWGEASYYHGQSVVSEAFDLNNFTFEDISDTQTRITFTHSVSLDSRIRTGNINASFYSPPSVYTKANNQWNAAEGGYIRNSGIYKKVTKAYRKINDEWEG